MHREVTRLSTIHSGQQGSSHHERVGDGAQDEDGDHPVQAAPFGVPHPDSQTSEHEELGNCVGGDETEVHGVRVVPGDKLEGEQRDGENRHKSVDATALLRCEDPPPLHGAVG